MQLFAASGSCSNNSTYKYNFNSSNGTAVFYADVNIGKKFRVPDCWKRIRLAQGVKITGSFFIPNTNTHPEFIIIGHTTSTKWSKNEWGKLTTELKGTGGVCYAQRDDYNSDADFQAALKECRRESAIRYEGKGKLKVNLIKSRNPRKFHIWAAGQVIVNGCDLISSGLTTDGVHGQTGKKSKIYNTRIAVDDDALYTQEVNLVKNCTIYHRKNGAPFQVGWGSDFASGTKCKIENTKVIADHNGTDYNSGVVSWQRKDACQFRRMKLEFINFSYTVPGGKKTVPNFFQFGGNYNNCDVGKISRVQRGQIEVTGLNISNKCNLKARVFNLNSNSSGLPSVNLTNCNGNLSRAFVSNNACLNSQVNSCGSNLAAPNNASLDYDHQGGINAAEAPVKVFPNPGTGLVNVRHYGEVPEQVDVFDMSGRRVLTTINSSRIDLRELQSGVYLIRLIGEQPIRYVKR